MYIYTDNIRVYFLSDFMFIAKLSIRYRNFPYTAYLHTYITSRPPVSTFGSTLVCLYQLMNVHWHILITSSIVYIGFTLDIRCMGFENCIMTCNHHYSILQISFLALRVLCVLPNDHFLSSRVLTATYLFTVTIVIFIF